MRLTSREKRLISLLKKQKMSVSHQFDHSNRVASLAVGLAERHGGQREIVVAAALCHDLGRGDKRFRGKASAIQGARLAGLLLKKAGYSQKEMKLITQVIAEHDDSEFQSKLIESRILKEADFLDGFGARGIMRSIMYAGETGGGVEEAVKRLGKKGRDRLKGLSFLKSQRLGWQRHRLTELFLAELEREVDVLTVTYPGRLVVVEGISGSGKDTQTKMLAEYLKRRGKKVLRVNHPTEFLKKLWRQWRKEVDDRLSEAFLMMADRVRMVRTKIMPALKQGKIVISSRSSISVQVYQYEAETLAEFYRYCFGFEPLADLVIYLDIPAKEALKRADVRVEKGKEQDRGFFGKRQIEQRRLYEKALKNYPKVVKVNALGSRQEIHQQIVACVDKIL